MHCLQDALLCFKMSITSMDSLSLGWEKNICGRRASFLVEPPRRVWLGNCLGYKFSSWPRVHTRLWIHLHGCNYYALSSLESNHHYIPQRKSLSTPTTIGAKHAFYAHLLILENKACNAFKISFFTFNQRSPK